MYSTEIRLNKKQYRIEVYQFSPPLPGLCWRAFKKSDDGWERIPCSTRAEENRFPQSLAWAANCFLDGIVQVKAEGK